jgi:hypothetical protein
MGQLRTLWHEKNFAYTVVALTVERTKWPGQQEGVTPRVATYEELEVKY